MTRTPQSALPISRAQLRRLQVLWHQWTASLRLPPAFDRTLRHYYVKLFSHGRARETKQLTRNDAIRVIAWLERLVDRSAAARRRASGTAGRRGFPEQRRIRPTPAAWRALCGVAAALGMSRGALEEFIRRHYARVGLRGLGDLHTMADLNRVLWGLKAILRRGPGPGRGLRQSEKKAA